MSWVESGDSEGEIHAPRVRLPTAAVREMGRRRRIVGPSRKGSGGHLAPSRSSGGETDLLKRDPFAQDRHIYYGLTAVARFEERRCVVTFEDPLVREETDRGSRSRRILPRRWR